MTANGPGKPGTGGVTRYISRYGSDRVSRGILLAPLAPFLRTTNRSARKHGIPWTHADEVNKAITDFIGAPTMARA
ncbi:hypothetical protein OOJ91_10330 [Micromonospora lupini]|uniref:hypothetical protein n=1 Tax=Micromonospora lupini TaxID=285679 RepID=UPI002256655B|nr:hypothetical protein [Micromonospora lupini]MCX5066273.1 hypothetical protein [Micromonospora lupini]